MIQIDREQTIRAAKQAAGPVQPVQLRHGRYFGRTDATGPTGQGLMEFMNGDVYCGSFARGNINGQGIFAGYAGTLFYANGEAYRGNFEQGRKS